MRRRNPCACLFALFTLCLHFYFSSRQGYFSDETYFIDCSNHLAAGYFDITPLLPLLIRVSRAIFGPFLFGLRFFPALGHASTVLLGGLIATELGGGLFSEALACLCLLIAPGYLMLGGLFLTPSLEPLFWTLFSYIVLCILARDRLRLWPVAGLVLGLGYMNKPPMLLLGFGLALGLSAPPFRRFLLNRWCLLGALVALAVALPNVIWQLQHDWNTIVFLESVRSSALYRDASVLTFFLAPVFALHPLNAFIWASGLCYLLFGKPMRPFRPLGWMILFSFVALLGLGGKAYYLAGIYPVLLAAGTVFIERLIREKGAGQIKWKTSILATYIAGGILLAPAGLPILPVDETLRLLRDLSLEPLSQSLQLYGVRHDTEGRERDALLSQVARVFDRINPAERDNVVILASHYFQTSWINVLGARHGLPPAVSGNNSYYQWGPGPRTGETTIAIGLDEGTLKGMFQSTEEMPGSSGIILCHHPRRPLSELWPDLKSFPFI